MCATGAASAVVVARESGIGLKVIWREEVECGIDCGNAPPFNSTWPDLFSYPKLRLAPNFPGKSLFVHSLFLVCDEILRDLVTSEEGRGGWLR